MVMNDSMNIHVDMGSIQFPYKAQAECLLDYSVLKEARDIHPYDISVLSQLLTAGNKYVENTKMGLLNEKGMIEDILTVYYGTSCINILGRIAITRERETTQHLFLRTGLKASSCPGSLSLKEELMFDLITDMCRETGELVAKKLEELSSGRKKILYSKTPPYGIGNFEHMYSLFDVLDEAIRDLPLAQSRGYNVIFAGELFLARLTNLPGFHLLCRGTRQSVQVRGILDHNKGVRKYHIIDASQVLPPERAYAMKTDYYPEKRVLSLETCSPLQIVSSPTKTLAFSGDIRVPNDYQFTVLEII